MRNLEKNQNEKIKGLIQICDKIALNDYETYIMTQNNKACFYNNTSRHRIAKGMTIDLIRIKSARVISEIQRKEIKSIGDFASSFSQLCTFENKIGDYHNALLAGLQSLALHQFNNISKLYFDKHRKTNSKARNTDDINKKDKSLENTELLANSGFTQSASSESSSRTTQMVIAYYNIGVQQEYLKRVNQLT